MIQCVQDKIGGLGRPNGIRHIRNRTTFKQVRKKHRSFVHKLGRSSILVCCSYKLLAIHLAHPGYIEDVVITVLKLLLSTL